jgi:hypothetical protein
MHVLRCEAAAEMFRRRAADEARVKPRHVVDGR